MILKDLSQKKPDRRKRCIGQGMQKGMGASMPSLSMPLSPNLYVFINTETLQTLSFWVLIQATVHSMHDWSLATDSTSSPSPLCRFQGEELKVLTLQSHSWLHWQPAPILFKSSLIIITKYCSLYLGIPSEDEDERYISYNITIHF